MARRFTIFGRIETEDRSSATVDKVQGKFSKLGNFLSVKFLAATAAAVGGIIALTRAFTSSIRAAIAEEKAINRLNVALRSAGTFSEAAAKASKDQADAMEAATGTSSRLILEMEALARTFTASNEAARDLTKVALDFASGAGIAFEESVRRLGRGVQGAAGDIANFAPEIRDLTKAQLAAGAATKILGERFAGQAAEAANTLEGRIKKLSAALENLQISFAQAFLETAGATENIDALNRKLSETDDLARAVGGGLGLFVSGIVALGVASLKFVDAVIDTISPVASLNEEIQKGERAALRMAETVRALSTAEENAARRARDFTDALDSQNSALDLNAVLLARLNKREEEADKILTDLGVTLEDDVTKGLAAFKKQAETLEKALDSGIIKEREYADGLEAIAKGILELKGETEAATAETAEFADETERAATANLRLGSSIDTATVAARNLRAEVNAVALSFDEVIRRGGTLSQAVNAALRAGGTLSSSGRRVNLPGGGSRFTFLETGQEGGSGFDEDGGF